MKSTLGKRGKRRGNGEGSIYHPKVVQERLGHSQISVTMGIYSHVRPGMQREAAAKFDEMLAVRSDIDGTSPCDSER